MTSASSTSVIDFHVHPLTGELTAQDILNEMKAANVSHAVLLAMDLDYKVLQEKNFYKNLVKSLEYTHIIDLEPILNGMKYILQKGNTPNHHVADLVRKYKEKFIGFGSVQIGYKSKGYIKSKLNEINEYKEELGFKGIKLLPTLQFFNPESSSGLKEIFKFAEANEMMILYHTGCDPGPWEIPLLSKAGNPMLIESFIKKFPRVKLILAHIGSYSSKHPGLWFNEALNLMKNYSNVYGDLSGVPFLTVQEKYVTAMKRADVIEKKLLFGSDYPVTSAGVVSGIQSPINLINSSKYLNSKEKEQIFHSNSYSLLFE